MLVHDQYIYPEKPDCDDDIVVKLTVLFQLSTQFIRQMFQHIGTEAAVRIS